MFPQPFEVELVGRETWEPLVPLVGPFVIAVGALLGVHWSNRNATRRHREQLESDSKRHQQRMDADREMHREDLESDRAVRGREEARRTVDEVTAALTDAIDALNDFIGERLNLERYVRERLTRETLEEREALQRQWNEAILQFTNNVPNTYAIVEALRPAQLRLRLRFPDDHAVFQTFLGVAFAVEQALTLVAQDGAELRDKDSLTEEEGAREQVGARLLDYVNAVRDWAAEVPVVPDQNLA